MMYRISLKVTWIWPGVLVIAKFTQKLAFGSFLVSISIKCATEEPPSKMVSYLPGTICSYPSMVNLGGLSPAAGW